MIFDNDTYVGICVKSVEFPNKREEIISLAEYTQNKEKYIRVYVTGDDE